MNQTKLSLRHALIAGIVVTVWGMNFYVIKVGLRGVPPLLLGCLRFLLVAFPAILFLPKPKINLKWLIAYGMTISLAQFAFLFSAIAAGMPAGLASLVLQAQAFFTVGLSALVFGDKLRATNLIGMLVASGGLYLLGDASLHNGGMPVPLIGFVLTLCAALSWATGNVVSKKIGPTAALSLVAWGALVPPLPFFLLSLYFEGFAQIQTSVLNMNLPSALTIAYLAFIASLVGYTLWGKLIVSLPTHVVAPLTLMVPVIGLSSCWLLLDEALLPIQMFGAVIVMFGLLINVFGARVVQSARTFFG
jgi:O-acetylserine/cysteine efflux transporter